MRTLLLLRRSAFGGKVATYTELAVSQCVGSFTSGTLKVTQTSAINRSPST